MKEHTTGKRGRRDSLTPIRRQYLALKAEHPDKILLFQMGDFYEAFDEDAHLLAHDLGVTLTTKRLGKAIHVPLAGIPVSRLNHYLARLLQRGRHVAICDQVTPAAGEGLVERKVVRVVSPGTIEDPALLSARRNNYLAAFVPPQAGEGGIAGLAYADISTGEFTAAQMASGEAVGELLRLSPAEVLLPPDAAIELPSAIASTSLAEGHFDLEACRGALASCFGTLAATGIEGEAQALRAAGAIVRYLEARQPHALRHLTRMTPFAPATFVRISPQSFRDLEVFESSHPAGSLLSVLDLSVTAMGGRLLRRRLRQPLCDPESIERRLDGVAWFFSRGDLRRQVRSELSGVTDLERLIGRVRTGNATPREALALGQGLDIARGIVTRLSAAGLPFLSLSPADLERCHTAARLLARAIADPPLPGRIVRSGYAEELDALRSLLSESQDYLADLEARERKRTGIKSLRVGYNKVFGYYIEVTRPNLSRVPADYLRKQTLVNAERFIIPELKEHEAMIAHAQARIEELEATLFRQLLEEVATAREAVLALAHTLAQVDLHAALAEVAERYGYTRPRILPPPGDGGAILEVREGRHPVVERNLEEPFVPNDLFLDTDETQIILLTGPNMAGKSTYLRQNALIVLLAQIGSFVPAASALLSPVDRIFTRVGLHDDVSRGVSTFLAEMRETAEILHQATPASLILLDEVGRGTATRDGCAIAQAVVEFLHNHPALRARTLFATHFHELTRKTAHLPRLKNFHVTVERQAGRIVFPHQVRVGSAGASYGIDVAALAGFPKPVLERASALLDELPLPLLAEGHSSYGTLSEGERRALEILRSLDPDTMRPIEALGKIYELRALLGGKRS